MPKNGSGVISLLFQECNIGSVLKAIEVTTGTDNRAQGLYKKTLGAEVECVIKNLFRGDEVIMIARFR